MYFSISHLQVSYSKKKTVFTDLSLSFKKGKITTIIGPNGCGKSTMIKAIMGDINSKGNVYFKDQNIRSYKHKELSRCIAYLPQNPFAPADIDVKTLVSYGRYPYQKFGRGLTEEDNRIIRRVISECGLDKLIHQSVQTLSGGERQRAFIAMCLAQEPEVFLLDEPTTYLDISYQIEVLELIRKLNLEKNLTVIMVLHDLNLASRYSDELVMLKDGKVYAQGSPLSTLTSVNLLSIFRIHAEVYPDKENGSPYFLISKNPIDDETAL